MKKPHTHKKKSKKARTESEKKKETIEILIIIIEGVKQREGEIVFVAHKKGLCGCTGNVYACGT